MALLLQHLHHPQEDTSHVQWAEPEYPLQDDILPGPPPVTAPLRQSPGYQPANSLYPEEYPHPYEEHHQQRFQYGAGVSRGASIPGYEDVPPSGMYGEPPPLRGVQHEHRDRHHSHGGHRPPHRHRHHRHHSQSPQHPDYADAHGPPPMHGEYGQDSWGPSRNRSRSRSFTPIPAVYREADSMDREEPYADPLPRGHSQRRPGYGPNEPDDRLHPAPRIGWRPSDAGERMNEGARDANDPEATLVGNLEPQIISPPIESDNPLETNVRHTREPDYLARHRTPEQEFAQQVRQMTHDDMGT